MAKSLPSSVEDNERVVQDLYAPVYAWLREARGSVHCFSHGELPGIGMHGHDFTEVTLVEAGSGHLRLQDHLFGILQGDMFVVPPRVSHGYGLLSEDARISHLVLPPDFFERHGVVLRMLPGFLAFFTVEPFYRHETGFRYHLRLEGEALDWVTTLFHGLERECGQTETGRALATDALALYVLTHLCLLYSQQHSIAAETESVHAPTQALQAVFELVASRYQERLTLGDLASAAHLERSHFCRTFHRVMGLTAGEFLRQYRVHVARRLLAETQLSIAEIAQAVGFCDASYFSRIFSRLTGLSPVRYRKGSLTLHGLASVWDLRPLPADTPANDS